MTIAMVESTKVLDPIAAVSCAMARITMAMV
jgi:hypothetical protein